MTGSSDDCIIFSKDRPWQLSQLLSSMEEFCNFDNIYILAKINREYESNYNIVFNRFRKKIKPVIENENFFKIFKQLIKIKRNSISFLVDDVVFYNTFNIKTTAKTLHDNNEVFCYQFKMNKNYDFCQTASEEQKIPDKLNRKLEDWEWSAEDGTWDWNYPFDLTGTTYIQENLSWIIRKMENSNIKTPNDLEECGASIVAKKGIRNIGKPFMMCPDERKCVCVSLNHSNKKSFTPWNKSEECTIEYLNANIFGKYKYDLSFFRSMNQRSVHVTDYRIEPIIQEYKNAI